MNYRHARKGEYPRIAKDAALHIAELDTEDGIPYRPPERQHKDRAFAQRNMLLEDDIVRDLLDAGDYYINQSIQRVHCSF